jgi:hypothetical protein
MFVGSNLSGVALDYFTANGGTDWKGFWLTSSAGAGVILLLVAAFFRSRGRIESGAEKRSAEA